MSIETNYTQLVSQIPKTVNLVAVSKTYPVEDIQKIYNLGHKVFGENKVQELVAKHTKLPTDIQWHLIGHLQTNKVKYIASFVHTIQSVDSEKLLQEIDKQARKNKRIINILLQVKIAEEDTKTGMEVNEVKELCVKIKQGEFPNIKLQGLMGMATFTNDETQIRREFSFLKQMYNQLSLTYQLSTLSMGMSGDFPLAIECGANSIRVGSAIFGMRNYQ
ncbi:YggS family pyridoxal phosphate-dependent enzyme [Riemerella anatipestifer]|uniref:YggS family pyridoxal phosphate-dependent enzyme n=1 Tax=Riemerella anatipestifer TaxID=34085 RepID=UPI00069B7473|nr:YggS family pyridoxal phosphate-dependent enzyme [Riemerella anatipestifer]MDY3319806.1 YggS family pyridoxal phosphate-dependent enzyme [Riemerella anatipestifer]MDY3326077.1 YggS family pyridoxal phosphate-dependent enzyme [Riemerella anatipestifer]MDY3354427.1 YggS family pyridoxal phosphate-dependent enzyme [Riemerella anatipestifer]